MKGIHNQPNTPAFQYIQGADVSAAINYIDKVDNTIVDSTKWAKIPKLAQFREAGMHIKLAVYPN